MNPTALAVWRGRFIFRTRRKALWSVSQTPRRAIMNVIGFCLMGLDKHRARTRQWRVPEKILFGAALLAGSAGAWAGMYVFHHKTRHWYFVVGIPLILAAQLALAVYFTR